MYCCIDSNRNSLHVQKTLQCVEPGQGVKLRESDNIFCPSLVFRSPFCNCFTSPPFKTGEGEMNLKLNNPGDFQPMR